MDIQAAIRAFQAEEAAKRSATQLNLGEFISLLSSLPSDTVVQTDDGAGLGRAISYRGYYSDLSFEPVDKNTTSGEILSEASAALGNTFEGYKGGDFTMTKITPLWLAAYSSCGVKLVSAEMVDGKLIITTAQDD